MTKDDFLIYGVIIVLAVTFLIIWFGAYQSHELSKEGDRLCQEKGYQKATWVEGLRVNEIEYVECSPEKYVRIDVKRNP